MILLVIAAVVVGLLGVARMMQLHQLGASLTERIVFGMLVANTVYILIYPFSAWENGLWPFLTFGVALSLWLVLRWWDARYSEYPIGSFRHSVLHKS